jgi:hypothetical protein
VSAGTFEYESVEGVYEHAVSLVKAGKAKGQIREDLKLRGLNDEEALAVANSIFELRRKALKESGELNMLYGALLCVFGVVVTAVTYQIAADLFGGGHYVIASGAIVFGAIQFFLGFAQRFGIG